MTPLEMEINYHNDRHWGMADDAIDDLTYHGLANQLDKEQPDSLYRHQIHNSIPSEYWKDKLISNCHKEPEEVIQEIKDKLEIHKRFTGEFPSEQLISRNVYTMKVLGTACISSVYRKQLREWIELN